MFQRFLKWVLQEILADIHQENDDLRTRLDDARAVIKLNQDTAQKELRDLGEKHERDLQAANIYFTGRLAADTAMLTAEITALRNDGRAELFSESAALRADSEAIYSQMKQESKATNEALEALGLRLRLISEEFSSLRKDVTEQIHSLTNTVNFVEGESKKSLESVQRIEDLWGVIQRDILAMFEGVKAEAKQKLIKMQWEINEIQKEPAQLRADVTSRCEQAIRENRHTILQELQHIGQFSSMVYRKLLELDGSAPASLYGRIVLPLKQGDPVTHEPPTVETTTGTSLESQMSGINRRLAVLEQLLATPLTASPTAVPERMPGQVDWIPSPSHFGNRINLEP